MDLKYKLLFTRNPSDQPNLRGYRHRYVIYSPQSPHAPIPKKRVRPQKEPSGEERNFLRYYEEP
jgi:hypothetical protein